MTYGMYTHPDSFKFYHQVPSAFADCSEMYKHESCGDNEILNCSQPPEEDLQFMRKLILQ